MNLVHGCTRIMIGSPSWMSPLSSPTAAAAAAKIIAVLWALS
jgi:hypothetical protein